MARVTVATVGFSGIESLSEFVVITSTPNGTHTIIKIIVVAIGAVLD